MKYTLHNKKTNEVIDTVDLASNVGLSGARTYFLGIKRLPKKDFDKIWVVRTRSPQDNWWKEDKQIIDDELKV